MNTVTAIETRRAVKHFDPTHKLTEAEIAQLLSLAILSPSAFNIQHWRLVMVKDPAIRSQIRAVAWGQAQVTDASLLFVMTADTKAWQKQPERYWANAPKEVQGFMIPAIQTYYQDSEQTQRDESMRSMGIAAQTIMLTARAMGYDSCPMDGFDFPAVAKIINLPADHVIGLMIAVGKATQPARSRAGQLPLSEVVIIDKFA